MKKITLQDAAVLFGTTEEDVDRYCGNLIHSHDFSYERITGKQRDQILLQVIQKILDPGLVRSGEERQPDWEEGWRENLNEFLASDCDLTRLIPKYFRKNVPARLNLEYIMPVSPDFVFSYTHLYRTWIFKKYLNDADNIYEFGCGPAYHLAYLAQLFPDKKILGLDWAFSSQEIIGHLSNHFGWNIKGRQFDFFKPDPRFVLEEKSAVLTFGALEQVGSKHGPFIDYLLNNKPEICVNVECLHELYPKDKLLSYLALRYHEKRNYLWGYLTQLQKLERENRIEIVKYHYHKFGNLYDDALSYVIWKPK